jgi:hypothetical protein
MKHASRVATVAEVLLVVFLAGCHGKTDANSELEKAAKAMSVSEPVPVQPPAPAPATAAQVSAPASPPAADAPRPADQLKQAMTAYKAGDLQDAVTRLQKLRATPVLTPQQRMSLNDAMAAVMGQIYGQAAKGDARAIQAVKQYEEMQNQPH